MKTRVNPDTFPFVTFIDIIKNEPTLRKLAEELEMRSTINE